MVAVLPAAKFVHHVVDEQRGLPCAAFLLGGIKLEVAQLVIEAAGVVLDVHQLGEEEGGDRGVFLGILDISPLGLQGGEIGVILQLINLLLGISLGLKGGVSVGGVPAVVHHQGVPPQASRISSRLDMARESAYSPSTRG